MEMSAWLLDQLPDWESVDLMKPLRLEWLPDMDADELETLIQAVYRQVLGNAYVMESERLVVPESQFKRGELSGA